MPSPVLKLLAACCLLSMPIMSHAQDAQDAPAVAAVEQQPPSCVDLLEMLHAGAAAEAVVRAVVATGMSLAEATVHAMGCGGDSYRNAIAVAGVKLASTLAQAQSVANAVIAAAGENSELAAAVRKAVDLVAEGLPQPSVYVDEYMPTGTEISPAS